MTRDEQWLAAAEMYVDWFSFSVIPMGEDKKPMIKWLEYQFRRPTHEEMASWPKYNLAIITGEISGIVVVDCESREDYEWFWTNRGRSPMVSKTRRGYHLFFRRTEAVKNAQRVTDDDGRPRYDVRGDGGYVLAPPSTHSEGRYYWPTLPYQAGLLPEFNPEWRPDTTPARDSDRIILDGEAYISKIHAVAGNGGDRDTYRAVCRLRESGVRESEAVYVLQRWNKTNATPPWTDRELLHKIQSVYG